MEQVWKCGFCSTTEAEKEKMVNHEKSCDCNPLNKQCSTCNNREDVWWNGVCDSRCSKGFEIFSDSEICNTWVIEVATAK